jgi:hypothetical protein
MSDSFSDERADMATNTHLVIASDGDLVPLPRNDMYVRVRLGSTATSITTSPSSSAPPNLRVTFDNTGGSGVLNVNSGEVQVPPGLVYVASVAGDGAGGQTFVVAGPTETPNTLTSFGAVQAAIDADKENNRTLDFPTGELTFTETLVIDGGSGGGLFGKGRPEPILQSSSDSRSGTTIIYNGTKASNEAAIRHERTDVVYRDLVIQGKSTADVRNATGTNTPRGIHVVRAASVGSGKLEMFNVRMSGFDNAIVCGTNISDLNCDESHYYSVYSHKNDTFFQALNGQCLSHSFYGMRVDNTDTVFDYHGGGKLAVFGVEILSPTTLLHLDRTDDGFGPNFSKWRFHDVNLDSQAVNSRLLTCEPNVDYAGSKIYFDGVHLSFNSPALWTNELVNVSDNMLVKITDANNLCANAIRWNTLQGQSIVHIQNSHVWSNVSEAADLFDTANSTGNLLCIVENCYEYDCSDLLNGGTIYKEFLAGT